MTIYEVGKNLVISLTKIESALIFGGAEGISKANPRLKVLVTSLCKEIAQDYGYNYSDRRFKITLSIRSEGCRLTLQPISESKKGEEFFLELENSIILSKAMNYIKQSSPSLNIKSDLYKLRGKYYINLQAEKNSPLFFTLKEFGKEVSSREPFFEYIYEYGKPIILNDAVSRYFAFY